MVKVEPELISDCLSKVLPLEMEAFLDKVLPKASPQQMRRGLRQIIKQADKEYRELALRDPLSRIPCA